jgi:hypothetical protein
MNTPVAGRGITAEGRAVRIVLWADYVKERTSGEKTLLSDCVLLGGSDKHPFSVRPGRPLDCGPVFVFAVNSV